MALSHYSLLEYRSRRRAPFRPARTEQEPEIHSARLIAKHQLPFAYVKPTRDRRHVHVVIVGGGLAGLMAGWSLAQQRFRVTILEAAAIAGGRVDTLKAPHGLVEAGAELIGKNHPRWISLAHYFNLGLAPISGDDIYEAQHLKQPVVIGNRRLSGEAGDREEELIFRQMRRALSRLNRRANSVNPYEPWKARHAERWDGMTVGDWLDGLKGVRRAAKSLLEFDLSTNQAVSVHRQSLLGLLAGLRGGSRERLSTKMPAPYWDDSETFRCTNGNQSLIRHLKSSFLKAGGRFKPFSRVTGLMLDAKGARVSVANRSRPFQADWVILATPPTTWHSIRPFTNNAIKSFRLSKYRPQMGHAVKYLARVDGRFWIREGKAPSAADTRLGIVWEATDTQNHQGINDRELVVFAGGPLARTKGLRSGSAATYFRKGLAGLYSRFRSHLTGEIVRDWPANTLIRGGYSCPKPGDVRAALKNMSKPAGRLVFAGEHASPAFFGFMEGALESGLHAAHLIFRAMNVTPLLKTGTPLAVERRRPVG